MPSGTRVPRKPRHGSHTGDTQKPPSTRPRPDFAKLSLTPNFKTAKRANSTKINRVGRRDEKAGGSSRPEMVGQPWAGMNLRRVEPHERRRAIEGRTNRTGQAARVRTGSGTPRKERRRRMTRERTVETLRRRLHDWIVVERAIRFPRTRLRRRSKMSKLGRLAFIHRAVCGAVDEGRERNPARISVVRASPLCFRGA
jgi:hypothetical protein